GAVRAGGSARAGRVAGLVQLEPDGLAPAPRVDAPAVGQELDEEQAAAGGGQLAGGAEVGEVVDGVGDLDADPAALPAAGDLRDHQGVGVGVHQDVGEDLRQQQHRRVELVRGGPVVQQLAQLLPGDRDLFRFGLGHRQHRPAHGGPYEVPVGAAAASVAGAAQQQHGDVVLAAVGERAGRVVGAGAVHGLDHGVGQFLQVAPVLLEGGPQALPAGVQVVAAGLDEAVGADQQGLAGFQDEPRDGVVGVRVDAQG